MMRQMANAEFEELAFRRWTEAEQRARVVELREDLARRRTVREFSDEPVPAELIAEAVRCAASAPSGANQQPWRFVAVSDPALKAQIRVAAEEEERQNYEHRFPPEWLEALAPFGTDWHKEFLEIAPWLLVVFRLDYGLTEDEQKVKHYYVQESVGIACGFLLAALHRAGLATLTHTPSPMGFLGEILGRPKNERPFLLIPVGYPAPGARVPRLRKKALEEVLVWA